MKVSFLEPAEVELGDAFYYYQSMLEGLGHEFIAAAPNAGIIWRRKAPYKTYS